MGRSGQKDQRCPVKEQKAQLPSDKEHRRCVFPSTRPLVIPGHVPPDSCPLTLTQGQLPRTGRRPPCGARRHHHPGRLEEPPGLNRATER